MTDGGATRGAVHVTCEEARTSIHFHLDGDDHVHVRRACEHTAACVQCERHLLDLREVEEGLKGLVRYAAPAGLKERILAVVKDRPQKQPLRGFQFQ